MINILSASRELSKVEKYLLTQAKNTKSIKDIDDNTPINVVVYCVFEDVKENGDTVNVLSMLSDTNEVYGTQSKTFKQSFNDICAIFDEGDTIPIVKLSGVSKSNRPYVDCALNLSAM